MIWCWVIRRRRPELGEPRMGHERATRCRERLAHEVDLPPEADARCRGGLRRSLDVGHSGILGLRMPELVDLEDHFVLVAFQALPDEA